MHERSYYKKFQAQKWSVKHMSSCPNMPFSWLCNCNIEALAHLKNGLLWILSLPSPPPSKKTTLIMAPKFHWCGIPVNTWWKSGTFFVMPLFIPFVYLNWQVLAAARHGYQAHGIELNPWLVLYSRIQARWQGLSSLASFSRQDLWKVGLPLCVFFISSFIRFHYLTENQTCSHHCHWFQCFIFFLLWVSYSLWSILVIIYCHLYLQVKLSNYDNIVIFGVSEMVKPLILPIIFRYMKQFLDNLVFSKTCEMALSFSFLSLDQHLTQGEGGSLCQ